MSKTIDRELSKEIQEKRQQLVAIREEVEDLIDYLEYWRHGPAIKTNREWHMLR